MKASVAEKKADLFARFDVDGSGKLSDDEKDALREFLRAKIRLEGQPATSDPAAI